MMVATSITVRVRLASRQRPGREDGGHAPSEQMMAAI
jgi:hypothetical protein